MKPNEALAIVAAAAAATAAAAAGGSGEGSSLKHSQRNQNVGSGAFGHSSELSNLCASQLMMKLLRRIIFWPGNGLVFLAQ